MVLLTSSTISLALSTSIICTFTFLLFLSGYLLQQQTVRGLQEALRAPPPSTPTPTLPAKFRNVENDEDGPYVLEDGDEAGSTFEAHDQAGELETDRAGKQFGHPPGSSAHQNYEQSVLSSAETSDGYGTGERGNEQAYIQLLSNPDPSELCSALLLFKTLEEAGSNIVSDRLLLYPSSWDLDPPSPDMEEAMAMLHAPGHGIEINRIPVDVSGGLISHLVEEELRESSLSFLRQYRSILYLRSPGLIVDVKNLDRVFHSKTLELSSSASDWAAPSSWAPTTIPQEPSELDDTAPPVLFVSSTDPVSERSSLEFYIPTASSPYFSSVLDSRPEDHDTTLEDTEPVYVHFQLENEELPDSNPYFRTWRDQLHETCPDIHLTSSS